MRIKKSEYEIEEFVASHVSHQLSFYTSMVISTTHITVPTTHTTFTHLSHVTPCERLKEQQKNMASE